MLASVELGCGSCLLHSELPGGGGVDVREAGMATSVVTAFM